MQEQQLKERKMSLLLSAGQFVGLERARWEAHSPNRPLLLAGEARARDLEGWLLPSPQRVA